MNLLKILIVDDVTEVRGLLRTLLINIGYLDIDEARNGHVATELCENKHYHVILLDIDLPDSNGMELLKYYRENYPDTAIIMCSAHSTIDNVKSAIISGAIGFLVKPFSIKKLTSALAKVI